MRDHVKLALLDQQLKDVREQMTYWTGRLNNGETREQRVHAAKRLSLLAQKWDALVEQ